ncbi:MAG: hypothetical protein M9938_06710 [Solirubrobacterales bacterium]|nr:hypothetical protein [Solirubrobacterales bacterium]
MSEESKKTGPARERQRSSSEKASAGTESSGGSARPRPTLTERQRIEARRRRDARRRRERRSQPGNALSRGVRATGQEIVRTSRYLARAVAAAFEATGPVGRQLRTLAARIRSGVVAGTGFLAVAFARISAAVGRGLRLVDRELTPRRALLAVAGLATLILVVSQFTEFRATAIGQPGYSGIEDVTHAPRVDVRTPFASHSVLLLLAALAAAVGIVGTIRSGRRGFASLLMISGIVTLAVSLGIDLPAGLDTGDAGVSYSGVSALLLSGFWLQLAAGAVLAASGVLLTIDSPTKTRTTRRLAVSGGSAA